MGKPKVENKYENDRTLSSGVSTKITAAFKRESKAQAISVVVMLLLATGVFCVDFIRRGNAEAALSLGLVGPKSKVNIRNDRGKPWTVKSNATGSVPDADMASWLTSRIGHVTTALELKENDGYQYMVNQTLDSSCTTNCLSVNMAWSVQAIFVFTVPVADTNTATVAFLDGKTSYTNEAGTCTGASLKREIVGYRENYVTTIQDYEDAIDRLTITAVQSRSNFMVNYWCEDTPRVVKTYRLMYDPALNEIVIPTETCPASDESRVCVTYRHLVERVLSSTSNIALPAYTDTITNAAVFEIPDLVFVRNGKDVSNYMWVGNKRWDFTPLNIAKFNYRIDLIKTLEWDYTGTYTVSILQLIVYTITVLVIYYTQQNVAVPWVHVFRRSSLLNLVAGQLLYAVYTFGKSIAGYVAETEKVAEAFNTSYLIVAMTSVIGLLLGTKVVNEFAVHNTSFVAALITCCITSGVLLHISLSNVEELKDFTSNEAIEICGVATLNCDDSTTILPFQWVVGISTAVSFIVYVVLYMVFTRRMGLKGAEERKLTQFEQVCLGGLMIEKHWLSPVYVHSMTPKETVLAAGYVFGTNSIVRFRDVAFMAALNTPGLKRIVKRCNLTVTVWPRTNVNEISAAVAVSTLVMNKEAEKLLEFGTGNTARDIA